MSKCRAIWLGTKVDEELVVDLQAAFHVVHIHLHNVPGTNEPSQTSDKSLLNVSSCAHSTHGLHLGSQAVPSQQ